MISGFEFETAPLSEEEKNLLPIFIRCLSNKVGKRNAVTNKAIRLGFGKQKIFLKDSRVRKIINHIRVNNLLPRLCATSGGYFIAENNVELKQYVDGLRSRIGAQMAVLSSIENQL